MRHGWVYIYESPPASKRFEELVDHFALHGISLTEPDSGRVLRVSPVGEQISSSRQDILDECAKSNKVNFNLYLGASDNLFCAIEKLNEQVVHEAYSLDGKTEEQSARVINGLTDLFRKRAENGIAFGLVADQYAELHRDFHWDDFFVGDTDAPPEWPMLLGFSKDFGKVNKLPNDMYTRETADKYILFRRVAGRVEHP
jgi:hypothetical protein